MNKYLLYLAVALIVCAIVHHGKSTNDVMMTHVQSDTQNKITCSPLAFRLVDIVCFQCIFCTKSSSLQVIPTPISKHRFYNMSGEFST